MQTYLNKTAEIVYEEKKTLSDKHKKGYNAQRDNNKHHQLISRRVLAEHNYQDKIVYRAKLPLEIKQKKH